VAGRALPETLNGAFVEPIDLIPQLLDAAKAD
jgi:hypothetical protein